MPASPPESFSFATIVKNDPFCIWLSSYLPIGISLILVLKWSNQWQNQGNIWQLSASSALGWTFLGIVAFAIGAAILCWRVSSIRHILTAGPRVEATVTKGNFRKHGVQVELTYAYLNQTYTPFLLLTKTAASEALRVGAKVEVALAPHNPQRAVLVKLFAPTENETV
ncbi:DUF3592 domain-containing protein [Bremerella cremea]|uniref:DUF3592 domain-containing protein n=1 Tax=Bremerella cremea TaxID=1031537 RepID=A0A368KN65_9BACT|nr:DUF3592 domain-containing protein [Bremerella cremea]RCS44678.1 DUF3592 domain-containing protein [Bremerella cremea]